MGKKNLIQRNIDLAIKVAHLGNHHQHLIGAVIFNKGNVVSVGSNNKKTHPLMTYKTLHGEIQALIGVRWSDLSGATMFVARVNHQGRVGMAKPCPICTGVLKSYGIRKVYFTTGTSIGELRLS